METAAVEGEFLGDGTVSVKSCLEDGDGVNYLALFKIPGSDISSSASEKISIFPEGVPSGLAEGSLRNASKAM